MNSSTQFDPPCSFKLIPEKYPINTFLFVRQHPESGIPYYQYMIQHLHANVYLVSSLDRVIPIMRYFCTLQLAKEFIRTTEKIRLVSIPEVRHTIPTPPPPSLADDEQSSDDGYDSTSSTDEASVINPVEKPKRKISEFQKAFRAYIKSNLQGKKFENRKECNAFFRQIANEYKDINQKSSTHN